jgi:hypothetical protein
MMPANKMGQIAFDNGSLMTLSLLGELQLGSYTMMGVFKSGQAMSKRSRIEKGERVRLVSGEWTATAAEA